ncbi:uncharacterized protein VICG_00584 [Vittaforma corneae ATCC 50505]|uniref:GlcNAc-PI synthesis protein n=1 Tax=Vittaforma corneae (strain ATCC 50505) TaxID=993615 RepID=L2GPQ1_VITCO|nr:uncharacterized protein VICG_00584 [Vittaforma corneae ATCC 50505]ELA42485.1 hypothetical protein VICG_00584 [Vittaforma corneae ATCC 50505]
METTKHNLNSAGKPSLNIALVSDFFYPSKGGVETHIKTIGEELYSLGHSVIIITHKYKTKNENYEGVKKIGNLVVYYLDIPIIAKNGTFPTLFTNYILFREIFIRHNIQIVHGHQTVSSLCFEGVYHASNLNIKTVITDHSLFEVAKFERILVNGLSRFICKNVDWAICVSEISKENTHIRTNIPLERISVIPNGIIPEKFYPVSRKIRKTKRILVMSRLVFRKGVDLLIEALPLICKNKDFEVIIVGNGPKKSEILQAIDENDLHGQVKLLEEVEYEKVPDFLRSADIFLNTSLTETFCLAILEAAACGLLVVSTNVGGIHEILCNEGILFCEPTADGISRQLSNAFKMINQHDPFKLYSYILGKYNWKTIAKQIEDVYYCIPTKTIDFKNVMLQFPGRSNFICRFGMFIEHLQIKLYDFFKFNKYL